MRKYTKPISPLASLACLRALCGLSGYSRHASTFAMGQIRYDIFRFSQIRSMGKLPGVGTAGSSAALVSKCLLSGHI